MAEASYPEDLLYHAEHDWARIDPGDAPRRRWGSPGTHRTRSARSCSSTRPPSAPTLIKDSPYAEVESVKAVSDVIAPLSGEIVEVNEALPENPAMINEDPYGEGLAGQGAPVGPGRDGVAVGRRRLPGDAGWLNRPGPGT